MAHFKLYENFENVSEAWYDTYTEDKDLMRIADIIRKADGNEEKAEKLASTMCKLIKDAGKAVRRGKAALSKNMKELARMFFNRALELDPRTEQRLSSEEIGLTQKRGTSLAKKLGILDF